ncbi:GNAT family N-acetyltransferase [Paenibacillus daejeonensis]|uniref:GNAT family N-acetyltransferase n=1 Tax=Paenibacillus daejeonensis TaxID=135193 RepID=UPI0003734562|nr:GNAT family N-acetyltransferase [Paenibacillus daejeonensis]
MGLTKTKPILLDLPDRFESERMVIRAPQWGDGAAVNAAVAESMESLRPWMPWAHHLPTVDETEADLRQARLLYLERKDLRLLLVHKETEQIVGSSGLHRIDWPARRFEIGYWVRSSYEKQGYITEAVHAITDFAIRELQANRVEIRCDARNTRSASVAERAGFTLEGILRSETVNPGGSLRDTMVFAKVRGFEYDQA